MSSWSCRDIDSPNPLQILLRKANAIHTVNKENIAYIEARKGHKKVVKHRYTLQAQSRANKKLKTSHNSNSGDGDNNHNIFELVDKTSTKNVDDIIAAWRYRGEPLTKEKIAIGDFIDRKLVDYDDLVRLNNEYGVLLDKYSQLPMQWVESHASVQHVKHNMELLQVAIGDVHERVLDVVDSEKVTQAMKGLTNYLCKGIQSFESIVPEARFNVDLRGTIAESKTDEDVNLVGFNSLQSLSCKHVLSDHERPIQALEPYTLNDKQYLASASYDETIKLLDMSNNTLAATLTGHTFGVIALASYVHNGIQMLASGSGDKTIKLWNLSNNTCVHTLTGHTKYVVVLAVYKNDDETILISGSEDNTIKLWNVDTHSIITTMQGHRNAVYGLAVYNSNGRMYLASGSLDRTINIWSLDDHALVRTIDGSDDRRIQSLLVVNSEDKQILASGNDDGKIKLWSVENYECIGSIDAHVDSVYSLAVVECDDKVCLVSACNDATIKIWDLESQTVLKTLDDDSGIGATAVFMNGDEACLATGNTANKVKLWME